jgi:proteic killer suppression protein
MILSFRDTETESIYHGESTRSARKLLPAELWRAAQRKLDQLDAATRLGQMTVPPGNRLEALRGDRSGQYSIRINDQYRICFVWTDEGPSEVEITDYH